MKKSKLLAIAFMAIFSSSSLFAKDDVTDTYIQNANLASLEGWTITKNDVGNPYAHNTTGDVPVLEFYHSWYQNAGGSIGTTQTFNMSQKVTLPAGNYRLSLYAFYREGNGNGTNTKAYVYAGSEYKKYFTGLTSANVSAYEGGNDLLKAANAFSRGDFENSFDFEVTEDGEIELGFHGFIDTYCSWCVVGGMKLYSYTLDDYLVDYRPLVTKAQGLYNSPMNATVLANLKDAVVDESTFTTIKDIVAAGEALENAIKVAEASIANYAAVTAKLNTLDAAGKAAFLATEVGQKYANKTYSTEDYSAELIAAVKAQGAGADMTLAIVNPSFETGTLEGWTSNGGGAIANNMNFGENIAGQKFVERWVNSSQGSLSDGTLLQTLNGMPNGTYKLTANMQNLEQKNNPATNGTGFFLVLNDVKTDCAAPGKVEVTGVVTDGTLKLGVMLQNCSGNWMCVDNFELTFVSAKAEYPEITKATGNMNATVSSVQDAAFAAFEANKNDDTYAAAVNAKAAAEASIANYEAAAPYVNKASGLDAAGKAKYAEDATVAAVTDAYNTRTLVALTDEQKAAMDAAIITAAKAQTTAGADMTLAIANPTIINSGANTDCPAGWTESTHSGWSWTKATGDTYMENWNGNAAEASFDFHQTITGLPNGTYKVTADMFANRDYQEVAFVSGDYVVYGVSANEAQAGVTVEGGDFNTYVTGDVYVVDGTLVIGVKNVNTPSVRWFGADNFKLTYVATTYPDEYNPEIVAAQKLAKAKDAKTAAIKALPVGDGLFYYTSANIEAALQSVEAAKSIEDVEAVAMPKVNAPDEKTAYALKNDNKIKGYLTISDDKVTVEDAIAPVYFEAVDGGFVITNGKEYVAHVGLEDWDGWTLNATASKADAYKLTINPVDGGYTLEGVYGLLGLDYGVKAEDNVDNKVWANKNVVDNGVWTIEEYVAPAPVPVITDLALTDKVATTAGAGKYNITYTRSFTKANIWQSLFVPFGIDVDEIDLNNVAIAKIDEITRNNDVVTINISKVVAGSTKANTPLFVAVKTAGKYEFKGSELEAGYEVGKSYGDGMVITGVLSEPKTGIAGAYVMDGGKLCTVNYDNNVLPVNRWYMVVMSGDVMAKVRFNIEIDGFDSDEATAIANAVAESVENGEIFSINGAKVKDAKSGLYIKNGKKILVK